MDITTLSTDLNIGKRAFVFGGAYSNLQATSAMLERARTLGFSTEQIIFTGDSVAYCANPLETAQLIRNSGIHAIMGNCEEAIAQNSPDCGCGFDENSACSLLSVQWYAHCKQTLDAEISGWMGNLPRELSINIGGFRILVTHATPKSLNQFVFPSNLDEQHPLPGNYDGFVVGHSGIPFLSQLNKKAWINSGAAGMPANDGTKRVWYAILETKNDRLKASIHGLDYNSDEAANAMTNAGLSDGYASCLINGIWPSDDVLPETEKSATGLAIPEQERVYGRTDVDFHKAENIPLAS